MEPKLSMRDLFACQALAGLLACDNHRTEFFMDAKCTKRCITTQDFCRLSYQYADEMMKAREAA